MTHFTPISFTESSDYTFQICSLFYKRNSFIFSPLIPHVVFLGPPEYLLKESKWVKMESGGGVAKLTLTQLAKDDEGLYTLRMVTKGGDAVHSAYVFVDGKEL